MSMFGWVITKDHINSVEEHNEEFTGDYHGTKEDLIEYIDTVPFAPFRLFDDDHKLYFEGVISLEWLKGEAEQAFGPLDCMQPDYGVTEMWYYDLTTDKWEVL